MLIPCSAPTTHEDLNPCAAGPVCSLANISVKRKWFAAHLIKEMRHAQADRQT